MLRVIEYFAKSLKITRGEVIQNWPASRKLRYGFLFVFCSNYGSVLYHFRDKAMVESHDFSYPLHSTSPLRVPVRIPSYRLWKN